jgi:hypothetical protein
MIRRGIRGVIGFVKERKRRIEMASRMITVGFHDGGEPREVSAKELAKGFKLEAIVGTRAVGRLGDKGCFINLDDYEMIETVKELMEEL